MTDTNAETIKDFQDLSQVSDDVLRQVAMRVHVVELAYAFSTADPALRERLLGAVRPGFADEIRSALRTVESAEDRYAPEPQIRSARAKVLDVARLVLRTNDA